MLAGSQFLSITSRSSLEKLTGTETLLKLPLILQRFENPKPALLTHLSRPPESGENQFKYVHTSATVCWILAYREDSFHTVLWITAVSEPPCLRRQALTSLLL